MKGTTKGVMIAGGVVGIALIIMLIRRRRDRIITPSIAGKMSDEKLKREIASAIKKHAFCGKLGEHKDNASEEKLRKKVKKVAKCMKKHAESMLNLGNEMKKRLCDKDPNQEGC